MKREEFTSAITGKIVTLPEGIAFLPDSLPPRLQLTQCLFKAMGRARGALGEFVGEARLVENQNLVIDPLAIREAVLSNKIEGTHTAIAAVLLQQAGEVPSDPRQRTDQTEVLNYLEALRSGSERILEKWPLSQTLVRSLQQELLVEDRGRDSKLGEFRNTQVYVGSKREDVRQALHEARYVPPPPEHVQSAMDDLFRAISMPAAYDPLVDCALMHYQFEAIHPFEDGNGRMGRLLIPLYLMTKGLLDRPWLYLSSYFQKRQDEYVDLMNAVSTHGAWEEWVVFFLGAIEDQADESKRRVRKILSLHNKYKNLVIRETRSQTPLAAVDLIMEKVYVTIKDVERHAKCTAPTARAALDSLEKLKIVIQVPDKYPYSWLAEELLHEVYSIE